MELRVLQYFLTVTREQSICGAANALHISQPTLSRQLKEMETELGKQLFIRGNRTITLTDEGLILRKRAEEILGLVQKTEKEIAISNNIIAGDIYIGAGETHGVHLITQTAKNIQDSYPQVHFHISSGDSTDVFDSLDKGLIDFGLILDKVDTHKYNHITFPVTDTWGVLMLKDSPLADREYIFPEDLMDKPLIVNRNARNSDFIKNWANAADAPLNIVATYNLVYNASLMVEDGMGYAISIDKILNTSGDSRLVFIPFASAPPAEMHLIWKKYQVFSKASEYFIQELEKYIQA
ncbi:MAG: LysR family transcriptional regulator [Clostridia bacterium]|nr:LysR family transcriptional regulator [Lachnospiraceae bacterium]NCB99706.1 LysR family transcriptional regulator [Clostridia bacterium]NCD01721.1 LysR family transcriptional regulator [Clostridia bacterium]